MKKFIIEFAGEEESGDDAASSDTPEFMIYGDDIYNAKTICNQLVRYGIYPVWIVKYKHREHILTGGKTYFAAGVCRDTPGVVVKPEPSPDTHGHVRIVVSKPIPPSMFTRTESYWQVGKSADPIENVEILDMKLWSADS